MLFRSLVPLPLTPVPRFGQALTGLDNVDPAGADSTEVVIHSLMQGLLGSPAFDLYERGASSYPFGMVLYYLCACRLSR